MAEQTPNMKWRYDRSVPRLEMKCDDETVFADAEDWLQRVAVSRDEPPAIGVSGKDKASMSLEERHEAEDGMQNTRLDFGKIAKDETYHRISVYGDENIRLLADWASENDQPLFDKFVRLGVPQALTLHTRKSSVASHATGLEGPTSSPVTATSGNDTFQNRAAKFFWARDPISPLARS